MPSKITSPSENAIRFSRVLGPRQLVAMGSSISVGLGIFILLGLFVGLTGRQSLITPFLVMALAALPIVLTYSERLAVLPGSGGAYNLARTNNRVTLLYAVGWFMLGGFVALIGVLGWGVALYLNLFFSQLFNTSFNLPLMTTVVIGLLALHNIFGTPSSWLSRSMYVYGSIGVLFFIIFRDFFRAGTSTQTEYFLYNTFGITTVATLMMSSLWGLQFILNVRDEMHRPTRTLFRSMLMTLGLMTGLGVLAGWVIMRYGFSYTLTPLADIITNNGLLPAGIASVIYVGAGLLISFIALNQAFVHYLRLVDDMIHDGFLPRRLHLGSEKFPVPVISLSLVAIASILLVNWVSIIIVVGLSAIFFLWIAAFTHLPEAFQHKPNLPEKRFPKLPFHPLFPWLTIAVGIFMPVALSYAVWFTAVGWIVVGVVLYAVYARQSGMAVSRQETVFGEDEVIYSELKNRYVVMVGISNPKTAEPLLKTAARLAQARDGVLLVLKVLVLAEQVPPNLRQQIAQTEWESLVKLISQDEMLSTVEAKPIVRLAPSPASGILAAVSEAGVNLLLLGWEGKHLSDEVPLNATLDPVMKRAACDVAILHGALPQTVKRILVPTAGGPYAPIALGIAQDMFQQDDERQIIVENLVTEHITPKIEAQARKNIQSTLDLATGSGANINPLVLEAASVKEGIISQARKSDLVLLGAAKHGYPERPFFGGLPVEIATKQPSPTILARESDIHTRWGLERIWEVLADALPTLTLGRQEEVYQIMRVAAQPNVDFFVLITLAAIIATLGLLQNSAAVIIGAMLVAPLMSPILAMAMSMVHGNLRLLVVAAEATVKGTVLAIFVGIAVVLVSPAEPATSQILARTQPNILDLMVALASGAAAGYAISRKEVAAALPGVAIAAALVPPLCVVGYGIGTSQLDMAGGALLLFITNLVAIIAAAAGIFLALGFHPDRAETGELVRGLKVTMISLGIILVILVIITTVTTENSNQQAMVEEIFASEMVSHAAEVTEFSTDRTSDGYVITATIIDITGNQLSSEEVSRIEQELSDALGGQPVTLDATIIPGSRTEINGSFATIRQAEDLFKTRLAQYEAQAITVEVKQNNNGYIISAVVIALGNKPITQTDMANIQQNMTESLDQPISIRATIISGNQINVRAPTPTPEP